MDNLKERLDALVKKYETPDFIKSDPVQFLHRYKKFEDIEIAGLIGSSLAYGKREAFLGKLNYIFKIMGSSPYCFCLNLDKKAIREYFKNFKYRFNTGEDIILLLETLCRFYNENKNMDDFLGKKIRSDNEKAKQVVSIISDEFTNGMDAKSYCYLFPSPKSGSACKRLNLFLKWMVRKSPVDAGIWKSIEPKDLIIPLDVHVARVSRGLNLTSRKSNDWQTAEEITSKLREFDSYDPIKYDFALFDIGIEKLAIATA
ncbi:MAG: TIGR02757 family protein [bacterium]|nr:TIGR02757 family protein [bacterium]